MNRRWTIGVAGHVDHGKTSLVKALTGIDTDRKPEEKARGLSIEAGVAELTLPSGRSAALVDVPGHTDYLKNAIRGLSSVDAAILVVAADDGVMPQTREHLDVLSFFKARTGIIVMSKADLVDDETLELGELELLDLLKGTFMEEAPILRFSSVSLSGKTCILGALDRLLPLEEIRVSREPFRLWIDQIRGFSGVGTVVSGTVSSGRIGQDAPVELFPSGVRTRVRSMESHGRSVHEASAGQRVGINLPKVPLDALRRGMVLAKPEALTPGHFLNAEIRALPTVLRPIRNRQKIKLHIGTSVTTATAMLMDRETLAAGQSGLVQFRTTKPVPARPRDPYVATLMNISTVIAGGTILEIPHAKFRPVKAKRIIAYLTALRQNDPDTFIERFFEHEPHRFLTARELSRATGFPESRLEAAISSRVSRGEFVYCKGRGAVATCAYDILKNNIYTIIRKKIANDPLRKQIVLEEISTGIHETVEDSLLLFAAEGLVSDSRAIKLGGGYYLPDALHRFAPQNKTLEKTILAFAEATGLTPFSADTIWKNALCAVEKQEIQRLLDHMCTRNQLIRLNDNRYLPVDAVEEIKRRVRKAIQEKGCISLKDSKAILGYGRWGGAPVFDYLDKIGFTSRIGNERVLRRRS